MFNTNIGVRAVSADTLTMLSYSPKQSFAFVFYFKTPKDIRISVKGEYWEKLPELHGRRLEGTIMQWQKKEPPDRKLKVLWEDGHDMEHLDQLLF